MVDLTTEKLYLFINPKSQSYSLGRKLCWTDPKTKLLIFDLVFIIKKFETTISSFEKKSMWKKNNNNNKLGIRLNLTRRPFSPTSCLIFFLSLRT
jgi:hypothetical protein